MGVFDGVGLAAAAVENPLDDPQVLAVAGPEELALLVAAEPVDVEDLGRAVHPLAHGQPVLEVVAHVVAAEGQHGHRVAADLALLAELGGGPLRGHRGPDEDAVLPVERLVDQRGAGAPGGRRRSSAEIGTPWWMLGAEGRRGALRWRRREAAVGMGAEDRLAVLVLHARLPGTALPVEASSGGGPSPPSHQTVPSLASTTLV